MATTTPPLTVTPDQTADRSAAPARFRERARQRVGEQDLLIVRIGRERFGMPLEAVDELVESPAVRDVPGAAAPLRGIFPHGESLLPLYDPSAWLGIEPGDAPVALVMRGGQRRIALAVDDADDVVRVDLAELRDAPRADRYDDLVVGVVWRGAELLTVVDARALVASCGSIFPEGQ